MGLGLRGAGQKGRDRWRFLSLLSRGDGGLSDRDDQPHSARFTGGGLPEAAIGS